MLSSVSSSLTHFWSGQQRAQVRRRSSASQFPSHRGLECGAGMGLNSAILGHALSVQVSRGDFYKSPFVEADLAGIYPIILPCHPLSHMDFRLDSCWDCSHVGQRQMKHTLARQEGIWGIVSSCANMSPAYPCEVHAPSSLLAIESSYPCLCMTVCVTIR